MKINLLLHHIIFTFLLTSLAFTGESQSIVLAKPSADQLAFQNMEMGVFIHFSIDTYADRGSIPGSTPAAAFNPTKLNADQWVLAAKAMGAKYVVLTARHEQGFCLWPTKTTDYSIKSSPYKNGHGDIVKEFVTACRKYGMKVGLYTPPWIDSHWESIHNGYKGGETANIDKLNDPGVYKLALKKEKEQIKELMTNYGPLVFIWDDHFGRSDVLDSIPLGGKFRDFYKAVTSYAHSLQPHCLLLGRDVEHVGNENGHASYPLWNALNTIDGKIYTVSKTYKWDHANTGDPLGSLYRPQIASTTNAFSTGGWMWSGLRKPQPLETRMKAYYETVGRGSSIIINLTPDRSGLIPADLVAAARETGDEIKRRFSHPIASSTSKAPVQTINFVGPKTFNHVITMEDLHNGQKISKYLIEAKINGHWAPVVTGETIGHKRIDQFPKVTATALRFTVTGAVSKPAVMRYIGIFNVSDR
jgi:alpha-L-fucosidase